VRCYGSTRKKRWKLLREGGGESAIQGDTFHSPPPKVLTFLIFFNLNKWDPF
jgi:hypothetical protein